MKYTIEDLIKIFETHALEYDKAQKKHAVVNDFNLPSALLAMCQEIKRLKR